MIKPSYEEFLKKAEQGNLIPVHISVLADLETPVSVYCKIRQGKRAFLLESVEGGETVGRYSFIGTEPQVVLTTKGNQATIYRQDKIEQHELHSQRDPLHLLEEILSEYRPVVDEDLPPFFGGAVGYIGYDTVSFFENLKISNPDDLNIPDCLFVITDSLIVFDHLRHTIQIVANAHIQEDPRQAYDDAVYRIKELESRLVRSFRPPIFGLGIQTPLEIQDNQSSEEYQKAVQKARDYIVAGDAFQIVLSLRRQAKVHCTALDIYRALRRINPSPYMFLLENDECSLVGTSPETLVKLVDRKVRYRPIAGTRPRGKTPEEDQRLQEELLSDPKECAEHIMLVDLGRNDIGRVCDFNTVRVTDLMVIERYSHVMHIVSNIEGTLSEGKNQFDALRATFPAGTLTGAPKIRAMEIIEELEPTRRGSYGGCVGYFSFNGNLDSCITIRTVLMKDQTVTIQAGAGLVYDSVPANEYQECMNKSRGMIHAIEMAEKGESD